MDPVLPQFLLTLPSAMARDFAALEERSRPQWFASSDPPNRPLGSGGGTANLLVEAWQATGAGRSFAAWLRERPKLIMHGGGQSRRLPAYAPGGKLLIPMPVFRWARGQRLNQTLLDLQAPEYERVLRHAGPAYVAMVASGDVLLRLPANLPPFPAVDVLGLGMWVKPEVASHHGVFICPRRQPSDLAFFLQKPPPQQLLELAGDHLCLVDTGMWLFSERAVMVLMEMCGWNRAAEAFRDGEVQAYELYSQFALGLGSTPTWPDPRMGSLTCGVVPLSHSGFHHFGTSRQLVESTSALQNLELDETRLGWMGARRHPDQYLQSARFALPLRRQENHTLWVENSTVSGRWRVAHQHILTGVPENDWDLRLEPGVCLDCVPVGEAEDLCVRVYGYDDAFNASLSEATWLGRPALRWFRDRGLEPAACGVDPGTDIQCCPLFPVFSARQWDPRFLEWLFAASPGRDPRLATRWREARRLSARELAVVVNLRRLYRQRAAHRRACLPQMLQNSNWNVFFKLDLETTARDFAATPDPLPPPHLDVMREPLQAVHDEMFRSAVLRHRQQGGWQQHEDNAFARLRDLIVREAQLQPALPRRNVMSDQIVWGRSPVRLDLAGGWTDTPPYCIEFGGRVLNLAVDLNGQPPVQVFAKLAPRPELVLRSIDLGVEEKVQTYAQLDTYAQPGKEFALVKAALALVGFLPRFHADGGYRSLEDQLQAFGGGLEISLLCAVPKGSGLGTSSVLAATILATLGDLCGLNWDRYALSQRTLALEQMLTTGGGWQDQVGAIYGGAKIIETEPGLAQRPSVRWLPGRLLRERQGAVLLYYTGLTRLARSILHEIVRGIFLNSPQHLATIERIGANVDRAAAALQACDYAGLTAAIRRSWELNQLLDPGTNPPEVQAILEGIREPLAATKLLGAGGGGYLLLFARDEEAAARIVRRLTEAPPNDRARFVSFSVSEDGLQVTRS
jgi:galactokinase/mevalonate kinase-like predicted kinase